MSRRKAVDRSPLVRRWLFLLPATSLVLAGCRDDSLITEPDPALDLSVVTDGPGVSQDDWIVVFRDDTSDPPGLAQRLVAESGGTIRHTYTHALKGFAGDLPPQAIEGIQRNPQVAYVERDGIATHAEVSSWGLDRIDQRTPDLDGQFIPTGTGAGVTVYILDTGIDFATYDGGSEFGDRLSHGWDFIDDNADASDCDGHGTHVAGTVGSATYGVAKEVELVSVRVLDCDGRGSWSDIIDGIDWVAADHAAKLSINDPDPAPAVANMSIQGDFYRAVNDAITNAVAGGVTFAVAAGNYDRDACNYSPASTPNAITVGATTIEDQRSSFSNYGPCVDLFGPGSNIMSTLMGGGVGTKSGTSMATPHVAGVAALWLQSNLDWSPGEVWTAIQERGTPDVVLNAGPASPNLLLYSGEEIYDPCGPDGCPDVWVESVSEVTTNTLKNKKTSGTVTVTVTAGPADADKVGGVTVNGTWKVDGVSEFAFSSGKSGIDGTVDLSTEPIRGASEFVFCVTGLTGAIVDVTDYENPPPCSGDPGTDPGPSGTPSDLTGTSILKGKIWWIQLEWNGGGPTVDVWRDNAQVAAGITNTLSYMDKIGKELGGPYVYEVCNAGTDECASYPPPPEGQATSRDP